MLEIVKNKLANLDVSPEQIQTLITNLGDFKDLASVKNVLFETLNSFGISNQIIESTFGDLLGNVDSLTQIQGALEDPIGSALCFLQDIFRQ